MTNEDENQKRCEKCSIKDEKGNCIRSSYKNCNCDRPEPEPNLLNDSNLKICKHCGHYIVKRGLNIYEHHNRCYDLCSNPYTSKVCMAKIDEPSMLKQIQSKEIEKKPIKIEKKTKKTTKIEQEEDDLLNAENLREN